MLDKKALSPVVATALLIVVAVIAVVGFQSWFGTFSSGLFSKTEIESDEGTDATLSIESLIGSTLYIKNNVADNLSINTLKIGNVDCNISSNLSIGVNEINVNSCLQNFTTNIYEVVLITDEKIISEKAYIEELSISSCTLDELVVSHLSSGVFYNSSIGIGSCFSQIRTCNNGILNGSSSYQYSTCQVTTSLSCITDLDSDGFFNSSCAVYPMTNTTFEGNLDTNDNNSIIKPDMNCIFNDYKNSTSCLANFVVDGCGTGTVQDISTGLCWQRNMSAAGNKTWANAITYCSTTLDGLGGNTDWRLPTTEELKSIVDFSKLNPAIVGGDNNIFQNVSYTNYYWTYTTYTPASTYGWGIHFSVGLANTGLKTGTFYVTCVRG